MRNPVNGSEPLLVALRAAAVPPPDEARPRLAEAPSTAPDVPDEVCDFVEAPTVLVATPATPLCVEAEGDVDVFPAAVEPAAVEPVDVPAVVPPLVPAV